VAAASALLLALPTAVAASHKATSHRRANTAPHEHVPRAPAGPPELLLTFDDGPNLERTPKVLRTLEEHHIHAVFFVNGMHFQTNSPTAERSRALLREIVARGHAVGNHTIHHLFLCGRRGPQVAADEIEGNARLIEQAIGARPELYRTPYGAHCKTLNETLAKLGLTHTGWDIDPQDWKVLNTRKVRDYVINHLRNLRGRNILLMHDIHQDTVEALPQILDWLDEENARRVASGAPPIRIIDYAYLLPPRPVVPPILDAIGRLLVEQVTAPPPVRWLLALAAGVHSGG
jgi:peptidoglycan/xylan/chitin deacetylase (PgdA/CDA1 family)